MKAIFNWRYWIIVALFAVGLFAVALPFGEPDKTMTATEWIIRSIASLAVGAVCFYTLYRCIRHWERRGDIPEFTNLKNE